MKRVLVAAVIAGLPIAAHSADLPTAFPASISAPIPLSYNWTGFYVGAQGGWSWGNFLRLTGGVVTSDWNPDGGIAGIHAAYLYQHSQLVYGIEGDVEWWGISGDDGGQGGVTDDADGKWLASVRGKLGWAHDRWLLYATGGWQWGSTNIIQNSGPTATVGLDLSGWTAGVGVDYAWTDKIIVGLEYRYTDFGSVPVAATVASLAGVYDIDNLHAIRLRLGYKF